MAPRGGFRKGAGRKPGEHKRMVSVKLTEPAAEKLAHLATEWQCSQGAVVEWMLERVAR